MDRRIGTTLVVSLLLVTLLGLGVSVTTATSNSVQVVPSQIPSDRVNITSDADFVTQGWPGSGTELDPYIISGLYFDGGQGTYIHIQDVTAVFRVIDCETVSNPHTVGGWSTDHIYIDNAAIFEIVDCTFRGDDTYIRVHDSQQSVVSGCEFYDGTPFMSWYTTSISFLSNHLYECWSFVIAFECDHIEITGNIVENEPLLLQFPWVDTDLTIYSAQSFTFTENTVIGGFNPTIYSRELNFTGNTFTDSIYGLEVPSHGGFENEKIDLLEICNNSFVNSGLRFSDGSAYERVFSIAKIEDNTVNGKPLLYLKDTSDQDVDCSLYGQIISYNCTDIRYAGGILDKSSFGVLLRSCRNLVLTDLNTVGCYKGLQVDGSNDTTISGFQSDGCSIGIDMWNSYNVSILDSSLRNGRYGGQFDFCRNITITSNVFGNNSGIGLDVDYCHYLVVTGNEFISNGINVRIYGPNAGNWDGNTWSDYFGIGPHIVAVDDGATTADHRPRSPLPWYALPVVLLFAYISLSLVVVLVIFFVSRYRGGRIAAVLSARHNQLLAVLFLEILAAPMIVIVGMGGWMEPEIYWAIGSVLFRVWGQSGAVYAQGPIPSYYVPYFTTGIITVGQMFTIVLILILTGNGWRLEREGASQASKRRNLIGLVLVVIFLAGSTYPTLYGPWFEFLRIPFPIGPFLAYITAKYVGQAPRTTSEAARSFWRLECPHCDAVYTYDEKEGTDRGVVRCQNCNREFGPTVDELAYGASSEEDAQ
jgi:predicted Zn finger-like uncharacterized protein